VTLGPRENPVTFASTWNWASTLVIAAMTSSLAAVRAFGGVPGASSDAGGRRYGRFGAVVAAPAAGAATGAGSAAASAWTGSGSTAGTSPEKRRTASSARSSSSSRSNPLDRTTGSTTSVDSTTGVSKAFSPGFFARRHHGIEVWSSGSNPRSVRDPNSAGPVSRGCFGCGSGSSAPNRYAYSSRRRAPSRFGGVFVMMNSDSTSMRAASTTAIQSAPIAANGQASIQPTTPPPAASAGAPSEGCGWPPKAWQSTLTLDSRIAPPMPRRPLSWTVDGWRNSHTANISMMTGRANATRPSRPPKV